MCMPCPFMGTDILNSGSVRKSVEDLGEAYRAGELKEQIKSSLHKDEECS